MGHAIEVPFMGRQLPRARPASQLASAPESVATRRRAGRGRRGPSSPPERGVDPGQPRPRLGVRGRQHPLERPRRRSSAGLPDSECAGQAQGAARCRLGIWVVRCLPHSGVGDLHQAANCGCDLRLRVGGSCREAAETHRDDGVSASPRSPTRGRLLGKRLRWSRIPFSYSRAAQLPAVSWLRLSLGKPLTTRLYECSISSRRSAEVTEPSSSIVFQWRLFMW